MNITRRLQEFARDYMKQALNGTWAKSGKSQYTRSTGEIVLKTGNQWSGNGLHWQSAYAAMSAIDYKYSKNCTN